MPRIFDGLVEVDRGQFCLEGGEVYASGLEEAFRGQVNGLCGAAYPHGLFIITATHPDLHVGEVGVDRYHFDFWLADSAYDALIKQTSERAAYWHDWVKRSKQDAA